MGTTKQENFTMIRLGFEQFTLDRRPAAWFWGQWGDGLWECTAFWSDSNYKAKGKAVPEWIYNWSGDLRNLDFYEEQSRFELGYAKQYIQESKKFIIPIGLVSLREEDFDYLLRVRFESEIADYIRAGKATVLFFNHLEGYTTERVLQRVSKFVENNDLPKEQVLVQIVNFEKELDQDWNFILERVSYWEERIEFFTKKRKIGLETYHRNLLNTFLEDNKCRAKDYTFLSLNRRWDFHRLIIAGFLKSTFPKKSLISHGQRDDIGKPVSWVELKQKIHPEEWRHTRNIENILKWFESTEQDVVWEVDKPLYYDDIVSGTLNLDLYRNTFVNLVTETYYNYDNARFLTEKTWKSIYVAQPFIMVGNRLNLRFLHELGYQTFDRWWDESYDDIWDPSKRLEAIIKICKQLGKKSKEELFQMTQEMEPVLEHNMRHLVDSSRIQNYWLSLENRCK